MNYQEFRLFREKHTSDDSVLRLDCMNPFKAMDFLKIKNTEKPEKSNSDTLDLYLKSMNIEKYKRSTISSGGVRESLKAIFKKIKQTEQELWLPTDVYPFYQETANSFGLIPKSFPTLPKPNFSQLKFASDHSNLLITNPISPLGRFLNNEEVDLLLEWLENAKDRRIILDTVYSYSRELDSNTLKLYETGQCYIAHSLSKAWIERGVYGALLCPESEIESIRALLSAPSISACTLAYHAMDKQPNYPDIQQKAFTHEWHRLAPEIVKFYSNFQIPKTGYFVAIEKNYLQILENFGALVIPASVFGSADQNLSIMSCLYNIDN